MDLSTNSPAKEGKKTNYHPKKRAIIKFLNAECSNIPKVPSIPTKQQTEKTKRPKSTAARHRNKTVLSRRSRETELILQRDPIIQFINKKRVQTCGSKDGIFSRDGSVPRMCGFAEAVRDRLKPGKSYLQGPSNLFKTEGTKYRLGRQVSGIINAESPDDLICFYNYEQDTTFTIDCTNQSSFGPQGPHHHVLII